VFAEETCAAPFAPALRWAISALNAAAAAAELTASVNAE